MSRPMKWFVGLAAVLAVTVALLLAGAVGLRLTGRIGNYRVPTNGMAPTLKRGDHVLADGSHVRPGDLRQGDVMVFRMIATAQDPQNDGLIFVQRLAALPGQHVRLLPDRVEVDGKEFTTQGEDGAIHYRNKDGGTRELVVPPGHVLTLGDNTSNSFDGRYWGFLPMDRIIQRAVRIYWPPNRARAIR